MSIKFEGEPPFYLGIAETISAQALDGSVVLRVTISVPKLRPKSVPVRFIIATDVAKALAEQLPIAVRMAEISKAARPLELSVCAQPKTCFGTPAVIASLIADTTPARCRPALGIAISGKR